MIKYAIISVLTLLGIYSFVSIEKNEKKLKEFTIPASALMDFSFDMKVLEYKHLLNEDKRDLLKPHQLFAFIPQEKKIKVEGYLRKDATPYLDITVLEHTQRPWLIHSEGRKAFDQPQISKVIVNGNKISSFDSKGQTLNELVTEENKHSELATALIEKIDPSTSFKNFLLDSEKNGWNIRKSENSLILDTQKEDNDITMFFDAETSLPRMTKIISAKDLTTINYKYECIDGHYVLVIQRTSIVKKEAKPNEPIIEYVSLVQLENVMFNH